MRCLEPEGETPVARGFADDQSSEASRSRRWHKTRKPNPKLQAGIDAQVSHLSHAWIQIAGGLAMNPKNKPTQKMQAWIQARKRHHLCHTQVHIAPRTGG